MWNTPRYCETCPLRNVKSVVTARCMHVEPRQDEKINTALVFLHPTPVDFENNRPGYSYFQAVVLNNFIRVFGYHPAVIYMQSCNIPTHYLDDVQEDPVNSCNRWTDFEHIENVVLVGKEVMQYFFGKKKMDKVAGFLLTTNLHNIIPDKFRTSENDKVLNAIVIDSGFDIMSDPDLNAIQLNDLNRAKRYFNDRVNTHHPRTIYQDTYKNLEKFFSRLGPDDEVIWDLETTVADNCMNNEIRLFGLYNEKLDEAIVVVFSTYETGEPENPEEAELKKQLICREFDSHVWVGWNSSYFDTIVTSMRFGKSPKRQIDLMLHHRAAYLEYKHSLAFATRQHPTHDSIAWKSIHKEDDTNTAKNVVYNIGDLVNTSKCRSYINETIETRKQRHIVEMDEFLLNKALEMKFTGMRVNQTKLLEYEERLVAERDRHLANFLDVAPKGINPNSKDQLGQWLFYDLRAPIVAITKTGKPAVRADILLELQTNKNLPQEVRYALLSLSLYNRINKLLGTYIANYKVGGKFLIGNNVHPDFRVDVVRGARYSSKAPNFQNIPSILLDIFEPTEDDCVYLGLDMDALELKLITVEAGLKNYWKIFTDNHIDLHNYGAEAMFGNSIWSSSGAPKDKKKKGEGRFKQIRDLAKTIIFLLFYGGGAKLVFHNVMKKVEVLGSDRQGMRIFTDVTMKQIEEAIRNWKAKNPELKNYHASLYRFHELNGYVTDPIMDRRRYFSQSTNALLNPPIQNGAFHLVAKGMMEVDRLKNPRVKLVNQLHDAVVYQVPRDLVAETRQIIHNAFNFDYKGMRFSGDVLEGPNWKVVK